MGRLRPGVSEQAARAGLDVIFRQSITFGMKLTPGAQDIPRIELTPGSKGLEILRQQFSKPLRILMAMVGLVLLIASVNVANLLLARAAAREKEIGVRLALGAGRLRLIRQLLTESILVAMLGGAVGLLLAYWGVDLLVAMMSGGGQRYSLDVRPDARVLGFTVIVSLLTGILFGLAPALRGTTPDLTPALKETPGTRSNRALRGGRLRPTLGKALVVSQVAMSLLLLASAGLFVRTLANLENLDPGFNRRNILLFGINPTLNGYKGERLANLYKELQDRIEALPGVRSASFSPVALISGSYSMNDISIEGHTTESVEKPSVYTLRVGPKFFETMGIPLIFGRTISPRDTETSPKVAVINEAMAHRYFAGQDPLGQKFRWAGDKTGTQIEIVGVVRDAKYASLRRDVAPTVYVSYLQNLQAVGAVHFEVRIAQNPSDLIPVVHRLVQEIDKNLPLYEVKTQSQQIDQSLFRERLIARLSSFFGLLALLLACVGIYGLMSFGVTQRTSEIGIRMALGAQRSDVLRMVMRETVVLVALGVSIGIPAALAATRLTSSLISSLLFGLKATDPVSLTIAAIVMASVALLAGYIPARRATKVDPMVALRYE